MIHELSCDPVLMENHPQLLAVATDELSMRVGQTLAGLLNATLVRVQIAVQTPQVGDSC
jgi:hypothetical protein